MIGYRCTEDWVPGDEDEDIDEEASQDEVDNHMERLEAAEDEDNAKH